MSLRCCVLACLALTTFRSSLRGEPPARTDAYGDPLPAGAVARLGTIRYRTGSARGFDLSPDGKFLAMATYYPKCIHLMDAATGRMVRRFDSGDFFSQLAFAPDGKTLAGCALDTSVYRWEVATGTPLPRLKAPSGRLFLPRYSADGSHIAALVQEREGWQVHIWDLKRHKDFGPFRPLLTTEVVQFALAPNGRLLATWGQCLTGTEEQRQEAEQTIQLWDVVKGKELRRFKTPSRYGASCAVFSPDSKSLAAASYDQPVFLWDVTTGKELRRFDGQKDVGAVLQFSPDGTRLYAGAHYGLIQSWETATGRRQDVCPGLHCRLRGLVFPRRGPILAWGSGTPDSYSPVGDTPGPVLSVWEVPSGKARTPVGEYGAEIIALAFLPGSRDVLTTTKNNVILRWDALTGRKRPCPGVKLLTDHTTDHKRADRHFAHVFSPDGKYLATVARDSIRLTDTTTAKEVRALPALPRFPRFARGNALAFSPDSTRLAIFYSLSSKNPLLETGTVGLWQITPPLRLLQWDAVNRARFIQARMAMTADSCTLAVGTDYHKAGPKGMVRVVEVQLYDTGTGKKGLRIEQVEKGGLLMALSSDGRFLALGERGTIRLFQATTGKEILTLEQEGVVSLSPLVFSPDGHSLASGTFDYGTGEHSVAVWETATGKLRHNYAGHKDGVIALGWSPDGRLLASGSRDTTVLVWDVTGKLLAVKSKEVRLTPAQLDRAWADLNADTRTAWDAMRRLETVPAQAIPFLRRCLRPAPRLSTDPATLARLIAELDSEEFPTRERAMKDLRAVGPLAEAVLRRALCSKPSLEVKRRIQLLLKQLEAGGVPPEMVRPWRALELLERIGSPTARQLVKELAGGWSGSELTREAQRVQRRLTSSSAPSDRGSP